MQKIFSPDKYDCIIPSSAENSMWDFLTELYKYVQDESMDKSLDEKSLLVVRKIRERSLKFGKSVMDLIMEYGYRKQIKNTIMLVNAKLELLKGLIAFHNGDYKRTIVSFIYSIEHLCFTLDTESERIVARNIDLLKSMAERMITSHSIPGNYSQIEMEDQLYFINVLYHLIRNLLPDKVIGGNKKIDLLDMYIYELDLESDGLINPFGELTTLILLLEKFQEENDVSKFILTHLFQWQYTKLEEELFVLGQLVMKIFCYEWS